MLGPALLAWAAVAGALMTVGGGLWLLWGGVICGGVASARVVVQLGLRRACRRSGVGELGNGQGKARTLTTLVLLASALLTVLGVRIEIGERARADPQMQQAASRGAAGEWEVVLRGYPALGSSGKRWVPGAIQRTAGAVPVLLWCDEGASRNAEYAELEEHDGTPGDVVAAEVGCGAPDWGPGRRVWVRGVPTKLELGSDAAFGIRVDTVIAGKAPPSATTWAAGLRQGLRDAAAKTPGAELVPGLAVGDTELVPLATEEAMRESSLTHLVSVSGANCALVTSAVAWAASWLRAGRRLRIAIQGLALASFVVVVGPDPSVQRAAIMATVVLVSNYGGKRAVALPALGLAIVVLLVRDPWQALHPGFSLSVAATGGILLAAPAATEWLRRLARIPRWLALPIAIAAAAQFACAPLLLLLQPGLPAVGVLANVLAGPAAPWGTGLGLLAVFVLPVLPSGGDCLVQGAALAAQWITGTAVVASQLPLARWPWPEGWSGAFLLAASQLALLLGWRAWERARHTTRQPWEPLGPRPRPALRWAFGLLGLGIGVGVGPTIIGPTMTRLAAPNDWRVVACDVGQGDAVLVRDPERAGEVMLIDTGDDEEALIECLDRFGVTRITTLVLSHDHRDHTGALVAVLDRVDRALIAPNNGADGDDRPVVRVLHDAEVPTVIGETGASGGEAVPWLVLAPPNNRAPADSNAASLVLLAQTGSISLLLLGDTGFEQQVPLERASTGLGVEFTADIVKLAHHGSRDQDPDLPSQVQAELGLVSVGAGNSYGHPVPDTMRIFEAAGTTIARTDLLGTIAISGDSGAFRVWGSAGGNAPVEHTGR